jgi:hypothetical protein
MSITFFHKSKASAPAIQSSKGKVVFPDSVFTTEDKELALELLSHPCFEADNPFFSFVLVGKTKQEAMVELMADKMEFKAEPVAPTETAEIKDQDYSQLVRRDLMALCELRGLDTKGNRDDMIARLVMCDFKKANL